MNVMNVDEIMKKKDDLYNHLLEAYEIAGDLRDTFSHVEQNQYELKEFCNNIRGKIYELREQKNLFTLTIKCIRHE